MEEDRPRRAGLADWLRGAEPGPDPVPGALVCRARRRLRRGGGGVQACHPKSVQASRHALEATRLSQRLGVAACQTQWGFPGLLGQPWTRRSGFGMTYRMKAYPFDPAPHV